MALKVAIRLHEGSIPHINTTCVERPSIVNDYFFQRRLIFSHFYKLAEKATFFLKISMFARLLTFKHESLYAGGCVADHDTSSQSELVLNMSVLGCQMDHYGYHVKV